jgi:hypothetical protein
LHEYAVGQHVSYAEDGIAWPWKGGYEILALEPIGTQGPQYRIRNVDQSYDRVVDEHELTERPRCARTGPIEGGTTPTVADCGSLPRRKTRIRDSHLRCAKPI